MRIVFDKNVPAGVRRFLSRHEVSTFAGTQWPPQLGNGELLNAAETAGFDVMIIRHQQNLTGRKLALVVLGSNIWPVVRDHQAEIAAKVDAAMPGGYDFIEMRLPPKRRRDGG